MKYFKIRASIYIILFALGILIMQSCSYLPELPIPADSDVSVSEDEDKIELRPIDSSFELSILFVPGGLVDPHAYMDIFMPLARDNNMEVVILKVRGNLSIQNPKSVQRVLKNYENRQWIIGGHSLGGVLASQCVAANPEDWKMLFLQGSYSIDDASSYPGICLSMRGSEDGLTTAQDWEKYAQNLPGGKSVNNLIDLDTNATQGETIYYTIEGGNHAQYGDYGVQKKDGQAIISSEEQKMIFRAVFLKLLRNNGYEI